MMFHIIIPVEVTMEPEDSVEAVKNYVEDLATEWVREGTLFTVEAIA